MTVKGEVAKYRQRLDKTLASRDLTDEATLKTLVKDHILRSKQHQTQESSEYVINKRTSELSNFLAMLRIQSHASWKTKQDTEEYRVMYCEGPEGSPYHTLLVEGYVDSPVDVCLCISVETALYPSWFPETKVPTFKLILAQCLRKIRAGESISLVRMKLPWPLSNREAMMHFFEFEYLEDGLVVVMINTPEVESIQMEIHDFCDENVAEAGETVRVGLVGGFALHKVTEERSYFRTIATIDVKVDFVPPWLINFLSRQLIGTAFKLYKKMLTTKSKHDEHIATTLDDPLYARIRKALYQSIDTNSNSNVTTSRVELDDKEVHANNFISESSPEDFESCDWKSCNEIEEEVIQGSKNREHFDLENRENVESNFDVAKNAPLTPPKTETMHRSVQNSSNWSSIAGPRLNPPTNGLAPNDCIRTSNSKIKANGVIHEERISEHKENRQQKKWRRCCSRLVSKAACFQVRENRYSNEVA